MNIFEKIKKELVFQLVLGVILGLSLGFVATEAVMSFIIVVKNILGQIIFFTIPLIILGFIAPSIASLRKNATKLLGFALFLAYFSTLGAGLMSFALGYVLVPLLHISPVAEHLTELPAAIFTLEITPIMPVMSALILSLLLGLAVSQTKSKTFEQLLQEFQTIALAIVSHLVIPILPFFIGSTFATLAYEGSVTKELPVFLLVILIAITGQIIWLGILYTVAGIYSKTNPKEVYSHYLPAYFTAIGTMSSAATLPVSLRCAKKSKVLSAESINFSIPLFTNIHLCGSVLTEVFFVIVVSQVLYGALPDIGSMLLFVILLGFFGIGAPGVPGGTVMASLGLITGILGFDTEGTALMMTIFALQDSFGTACNVTGDGALTLMVEAYRKKI
ncbi:MAG: dicarboxylate/amino acid:cation symporter [Eubacteriales bacterium]